MLTIFAFWVLVPATFVAIAIVYRPRPLRTVVAVVEPRSHVRIVERRPATGMAPVIALADRARRPATRHSA